MAKDLIKKEENAVVDASMFEGQETGFEGTSADTFKTPFLKILQTLSPEMKPGGPNQIEGAMLGDFCNSATKELYKELNIIVLKIDHSVIGWKPDRGGFVGRFTQEEAKKLTVRKDGMNKYDADGNDLSDTIELFCINADNPADIFIFPLSGASMKYGKAFATRLRMLQSDGKPVGVSWAGVWTIKTIEDKNDKGDWFTIGSTPEFNRFINQEERDGYILPAKEMLKTAETDYNNLEGEAVDDKEPVDY